MVSTSGLLSSKFNYCIKNILIKVVYFFQPYFCCLQSIRNTSTHTKDLGSDNVGTKNNWPPYWKRIEFLIFGKMVYVGGLFFNWKGFLSLEKALMVKTIMNPNYLSFKSFLQKLLFLLRSARVYQKVSWSKWVDLLLKVDGNKFRQWRCKLLKTNVIYFPQTVLLLKIKLTFLIIEKK